MTRYVRWAMPVLLMAVLVGCPQATVVTLSPSTASLQVNGTITFTAASNSAQDDTFNWTSSDNTVLQLSATTGDSVTATALAAGTATVTAEGSGSGATQSVLVTVSGSGAQAVVTLNPSTAELQIGDTYNVSATSTSAADTTFNWASSDAAVVQVSAATGTSVTLTALAVGEADVTATGSSSGRTSTVRVSVVSGDPVVIPATQLAPGLDITVESVTIPADRRALVTFIAKDSAGNLVGKKELSEARFILTYLKPSTTGGTSRYWSYITRTEDPDGVANSGDEAIQATYDDARLNGITQSADGTMTYRFATAVPADFNATLTHQVAGQFRRLYAVDSQNYVSNPTFVFRPDGAEVTEKREVSTTDTCNECHSRMGFHGGARREYQLCITCHTDQTTDAQSGNTVDMAVMVHKIHMGELLPSVEAGTPYEIVGNANTVHDYSTVMFPQSVLNCETCHAENEDAPNADYWKTKPTTAGCGSCHDRTWFGPAGQKPEGFTLHTAGEQPDAACAFCHTPTNIDFHHQRPQETADAPGLALDITEVHPNPADGSLRILFSVVNGAGEPVTDLSALSSLAATYAYYLPDYGTYKREVIRGSGATGTLVSSTSPTGIYDYTFGSKLPVAAGKTYAVAMESRLNFTHLGVSYQQGTDTNGLTFFTMDGSEPEPRREVVDAEACNKCHGEMRFHGEQRVGVEYCLLCHNPNTSDESRRPVDANPPVTVNLKDMLHKIHTGENLTQPYTVYGFGNVAHDMTEFRYPADRRDCTMCHVEGAEELPLPEGVLPTVVRQSGEVVERIEPERAACTSCHDDVLSNVHAVLNTTAEGVESCSVCHSEGSLAAVSTVHAIEP